MKLKSSFLPAFLFMWIIFSCSAPKEGVKQPTNLPTSQPEIFYHVFQRSFYDSNGDQIGDLKGLEQKLDYLQELGVTSILLLPLYESVYYHNYFPTDFKKIDPEFGTMEDYLSLVRNVHQRGMKIYMDMEIHYVTEDHQWYKDSYQNPSSDYSDYLLYNGPNNTQPESIIFNLTGLKSYDGTFRNITTLNLHNKKVKQYLTDLFLFWVDPNQDGHFDDGVDGFRIDHMMDDLDWKGKMTGLFTSLWNPMFKKLKTKNPAIKIIGEQANWDDYGQEYFTKTGLDRTFAFGIKFAITAFNTQQIIHKTDSTFLATPSDKNQLIFIENHDTHRFSHEVEGHREKLKVAAALNLLLKGIPIIYYGQELGMTGKGGFGAFGESDANDIPRREAFEWYAEYNRPGMALWYKDSGPWWDQTNLKNKDGISLEEQKDDPNSLWNFYRQLIAIRKASPAITSGDIHFINKDDKNVLAFLRSKNQNRVLVVMNLSNKQTDAVVDPTHLANSKFANELLTQKRISLNTTPLQLQLAPFEINVFELQNE